MNQKHNISVGSIKELSLRVSVAALVRVLFKNPNNAELMLALERKATLRKAENERLVEVKSQPFGGVIRILDVNVLHDAIGDFHFDIEQSRAEQDFRLFIRPSAWPLIREFCLQHFRRHSDLILETNPTRELTEELEGALKIDLAPEQYVCSPIATLIENEPSPTGNYYSKGALTVRVYRIFEASITNSTLADALLKNSERISDQCLRELVLQDFESGGNGWANAVLALPLKSVSEFYFSIPPLERNSPIKFDENWLDETVSTILDGITVPKYQRLA